MTRAGSLLLSMCVIAALAVLPAAAGPGPKGGPGGPPGQHPMVRHAGDPFCPARTLVAGNVVIPAGQCFMLSVLRDRTGTFLAFVPQGERIPPGQLVRLNTPAGPKLKGRLFLIPLSTTGILVPLDTMTLVAVQIVQLAAAVRFILTGLPAPVQPVDVHER
ncbi:MAG TPA: hypothetical protein VGX75_18440 [bacterium]|nr:hypothetical protein [bacterium]